MNAARLTHAGEAIRAFPATTGDRLRSVAAETLALLLLVPLVAALATSKGYGQWWLASRGWLILGETLAFAAAASTIGLLAASVAARGGVRWAAVACVPLIIPSSLLGSAWIAFAGRGGPLGDWFTVYDPPVAAAAVGLRVFGVGAMILALWRPGADVAAGIHRVRGAWWWLGLRPALRPAALAWLVMLLLASADHVMPSMLLVPTYGTQVLIQYNALLDAPGAVALAAPMLAVGAIVLLVATALVRTRWSTPRPAVASPVRWSAVALIAVVVGGPIVALAVRVERWSAVPVAMADMREELLRTLLLAAVGGLVGGAAAWLLATQWLAARRRGVWTLVPLTLLNVAAPASVLAFGVIDLAGHGPLARLAGGDAPLLAALLARFVPVAVLVLVAAGLRRADAPEAAVRAMGVRGRRRWHRIIWPARRRAVLAAGLLVGLLVATELDISVLLNPAGTSTAGVRLYTLIHTAPDALVSAAALATAIVLVPAVVLLGGLGYRPGEARR